MSVNALQLLTSYSDTDSDDGSDVKAQDTVKSNTNISSSKDKVSLENK